LFVFLQKILASLAPHYPELSFKLYLEAAVAGDKCAVLKARAGHVAKHEVSDSLFKEPAGADFSSIAYEFMSQAFVIYEDEISDSKAQFRSIALMIGSLLSCKMFEKEDYEALITKTAQYGARLLKKPDQCRIVMLCSHLFYRVDGENSYCNPQRVLECLQRALKIADVCMTSSNNLQLFIEILEHYVYYFEKENPAITDKFVSGLIALINELIDTMKDYSDASVQAQTHYRLVLQYIAQKKRSEDSAGRFASILS